MHGTTAWGCAGASAGGRFPAVLIDHLKRALGRAGRTTAGQKAVEAVVLTDPRLARWPNGTSWPSSFEGFEDVAMIFSSNRLNHGIATLQIDEAALLFRCARHVPEGSTVAEIGRFKGGSTFLIATALPAGAHLVSYDIHMAIETDIPGVQLDRELSEVLTRAGLADRVELVIADSRTVAPPPEPLALLFIDGDHSAEGVRADWAHWRGTIAPGGHVLFHDAVTTGGFSRSSPGVVALVDSIEKSEGSEFARQPNAGAIAHFVRR
jgi:predicted O-methyltransferase YrrM